jgi:hypothetical protein
MRNITIAAGFLLAISVMIAMNAAQAADTVMSDGKCFVNVSNGNWAWGACPKEHGKHHHKG